MTSLFNENSVLYARSAYFLRQCIQPYAAIIYIITSETKLLSAVAVGDLVSHQSCNPRTGGSILRHDVALLFCCYKLIGLLGIREGIWFILQEGIG